MNKQSIGQDCLEESSQMSAPCRLCGLPLQSTCKLRVRGARNGVLAFLSRDGQEAGDPTSDVKVHECESCGLVQIAGQPVRYSGLTSVSASLDPLQEFRRAQLAEFVTEFNLADRPVVEIGCGDGHGLATLQALGAKPYGVDVSAGGISQCRSRGFPAQLQAVGAGGVLDNAPFAGCVALHVLEHVPDIRMFLSGIRANLATNGVALIEVPALEQLVKQRRHIEFFADHLSYFSHSTLRLALELSGFEVVRIKQTWFDEHLTATVRARNGIDWQSLRQAREELIRSFSAILGEVRARGGRFAIWGASAQAVTLLAELGPELTSQIAFVIDSSEAKQGHRLFGNGIEIVPPTSERLASLDYILITATRFEEGIRDKLSRVAKFSGHVAVLRENEIIPCKKKM